MKKGDTLEKSPYTKFDNCSPLPSIVFKTELRCAISTIVNSQYMLTLYYF